MDVDENQDIVIDGCNVSAGKWFVCIDDSPDTSAVYYVGQDGRQYASFLSEAVFVGKP